MKVKINTHGNPMPVQYGEFIDLYTAEEVYIGANQYRLISLGCSMQVPDGYFAIVAPRSSTFIRWGIFMTNSIGIIENDYCGDNDIWRFPAYALRETRIPKGTRICQFCLMKKPEPIELEQVESLGNPDRGGLGSTGE